MWTVACGIDMSLAMYALQYVGELKLVSNRYEALKSGESYRKNLKETVDAHSELIEVHHILEDIYGLSILWIAVSSAVAFCFTVYQISVVCVDFIFFFFFFFYQLWCRLIIMTDKKLGHIKIMVSRELVDRESISDFFLCLDRQQNIRRSKWKNYKFNLPQHEFFFFSRLKLPLRHVSV